MSEFVIGKAGGTSNADANAVQMSLEWAEQTDLFVPSAPGKLEGEEGPHAGKVTDMLLKARQEFEHNGYVSGESTGLITERFAAIVRGLGSDSISTAWVDSIPLRVQEAARASEDAASMLGECLMGEIYEGQGFHLLDPGRGPENLGSDLDLWRAWMDKDFKPGQKHVLLGNTTRNDGQKRTFSRGGSDTSEGFAGYGIRAALAWNLTDGPARSADPRLVGDDHARHLDHLLYVEGRELGRNGTGLVHPAAMVPLMLANIPTEIRSTFDKNAPFTLLDNDTARAEKRAGNPIALSLMNDVAVIRVHEPGMADAVGRLDAFESALSEAGIALVDSQGDGVDGQTYFIASEKADRAGQILRKATLLGGIAERSKAMSFITLVGFQLEQRIIEHINTLTASARVNGEQWQAGKYPLSPGHHSLRIGIALKDSKVAFSQAHHALIESQAA